MADFILVGISGKKQSGKNTLAIFIRDVLGDITSEEIGFADAVKEEVAKHFMISVEALIAKKEFYRTALQIHGTTKREDNPAYWIELIFKKILKSQSKVVFVTDVRFKNEADSLREAGAILIRVNRNTGLIDNHISEIDLDNYPFEFICDNDGLNSLKIYASNIANKIKLQLTKP
jgi:phosphomevalonate kinase